MFVQLEALMDSEQIPSASFSAFGFAKIVTFGFFDFVKDRSRTSRWQALPERWLGKTASRQFMRTGSIRDSQRWAAIFWQVGTARGLRQSLDLAVHCLARAPRGRAPLPFRALPIRSHR